MSYDEFKKDLVKAEIARLRSEWVWTLGIAAVLALLFIWGSC